VAASAGSSDDGLEECGGRGGGSGSGDGGGGGGGQKEKNIWPPAAHFPCSTKGAGQIQLGRGGAPLFAHSLSLSLFLYTKMPQVILSLSPISFVLNPNFDK